MWAWCTVVHTKVVPCVGLARRPLAQGALWLPDSSHSAHDGLAPSLAFSSIPPWHLRRHGTRRDGTGVGSPASLLPYHLPASLDPPSLNKGPAWQGGPYVGSPAPGTSLLLLPVGGSGCGLPHPSAHGGPTT